MTAGLNGRGVVSPITRALLVDSGWYDMSPGSTEPLQWGRGAGCPFMLRFCYEQLSQAGYENEAVGPFCTIPGGTACGADHRGYGQCGLGFLHQDVSPEHQNFGDGKKRRSSPSIPHPLTLNSSSDFRPDRSGTAAGSDVFADRCPYYSQSTLCSDLAHQPS